MSTFMVSYQEISISNKFCFPWWYYPFFAAFKWFMCRIIFMVAKGFDYRLKAVKAQPLLMNDMKIQKVFDAIAEVTHLPNDVINEILSYVTIESSQYDMLKYIHNKKSFKLFSGYLIVYSIVDVIVNIYCWCMAINHWINAFKIETKGWKRYILLTFDSLLILPSYIPITVVIHYVALLYVISKKLDYYELYYTKCDYCARKCVIVFVCFILGILKVPPSVIAMVASSWSVITPGIFITIPVTVVGFILIGIVVSQLEFYQAPTSRTQKFCQFTGKISMVVVGMLSYGVLASMVATTVCVYDGNKWGQCLLYGIESQYCPKFNFDYSFDSCIWIMKWALF